MAEPQFATVNGIRIAYDRVGSGYPALLIHGFPRDRRLWRKLIPHLADRFDTVALDRRGYGDSDRPADAATYDNATMASDALELTRQLGWDKFLVVGHDLGQPVAQRLAADHADALVGAVLLDGLPHGYRSEAPRDPSGRAWYMDFFRQRGVAEPIISQNPRLFFSLFIKRHQHLTEDEIEMFVEPFTRPGSVDAVLADYRHTLEDDNEAWTKRWQDGGRITTPLCVLWAARGPSGNSPVLDIWKRIADNVRGAPIQDTAHYLQEEQPHAVAKQIHQFADELGIA